MFWGILHWLHGSTFLDWYICSATMFEKFNKCNYYFIEKLLFKGYNLCEKFLQGDLSC